MGFTSNIRWLLVVVFLAGCTGANDRPATATSPQAAVSRDFHVHDGCPDSDSH